VPYIRKELRPPIDDVLDPLIKRLKEMLLIDRDVGKNLIKDEKEMAGCITYVIFKLIRKFYAGDWSFQTIKFIYLLDYFYLEKVYDKCSKARRKEIENIIENIGKIIESRLEHPQNDIIDELWLILRKRQFYKDKKESFKNGKGRKTQRNIRSIRMNTDKSGKEIFENHLLKLKVENANDAEILMNEYLKYITLMEGKNGKIDVLILLLEKWIGKNFNSFVPIAIESLQSKTKWYDKMDAEKVVASAIDEFKRRFLHPYEDEAIKKNGDVQ
jgi:hypothetical protein